MALRVVEELAQVDVGRGLGGDEGVSALDEHRHRIEALDRVVRDLQLEQGVADLRGRRRDEDGCLRRHPSFEGRVVVLSTYLALLPRRRRGPL